MNWLSILGCFLIIPIQTLFFILEVYANIAFLGIMQLTCILILIFKKLRYYVLAHSLLGSYGVCLVAMSIYTKLTGTTNPLVFVFPPHQALIFLGLIPLAINNPKYLWIRFVTSMPNFLCIAFFKDLHALFGIDIYAFPIGKNTTIFTVSHILVFMNIGVFVVTIQNINKKFEAEIKKLYEITEEKNEELKSQNDIISLKNNQITQSINYAKRIQNALIPPPENLQKIIPESFIFFRPRDTVSGNFYQFYDLLDKVFIGAIDCTGHGILGLLCP